MIQTMSERPVTIVRRGTKGECDGNFKSLLPLLEDEKVDAVVRITGDNPLICPTTIEACIKQYAVLGRGHASRCDRWNDKYGDHRQFPPGQDAELIPLDLLIEHEGSLAAVYAAGAMHCVIPQLGFATRWQGLEYNSTVDNQIDYGRVCNFLTFAAGKYSSPFTFSEQLRLWEEHAKYKLLDG